MSDLRKYLNTHPIISILIVIWACGIVSFATYCIFIDPSVISMAVATAYGSLLGIPAVAFGLYQNRMKSADKEIINAKLNKNYPDEVTRPEDLDK